MLPNGPQSFWLLRRFIITTFYFYRPKRSFGQGNVFTRVCDSVNRGEGAWSNYLGGGACSKFSGGGIFFWGVGWGIGACSKFWGVPAPNFGGGVFFRGGACSKFFWGEVPALNFGGCLLQILGGACSNFFGGVPAPIFWGAPIFGIRSPFGRYASYWNAFLLIIMKDKGVNSF